MDTVIKIIDWLYKKLGGGGVKWFSILLGVTLVVNKWCYHYVVRGITREVYTIIEVIEMLFL